MASGLSVQPMFLGAIAAGKVGRFVGVVGDVEETSR
jgi:hypothetical protein